MAEGNSAADLRRWLDRSDPGWVAGIEVVATDLAESVLAGLSPALDHTRRVADPFHVVRVANRCVDQVRERVQNETLGHRGRTHDPLSRLRKVLLAGTERLDDRGQRMLLGLRVGDPHDEVLGVARQGTSCAGIPRRAGGSTPAPCRNKTITGYLAEDVPEIVPLGTTSSCGARRSSPTTAPAPATASTCWSRRVKLCDHRLRSFDHYRLRVLLHTGGVT